MLFKKLIILLRPPRVLGWRSLFYLSIIAWLMALLAGGVLKNPSLQNRISFWGCLLLLIAYGWFAIEKPFRFQGFSLTSWIMGVFLCMFLASLNNKTAPIVWFICPPLSATLAAWPELVDEKRKFKIPSPEVRAKLLIWFFSHLVVSCWIQFNTIIQNWLQQYPSLLTEDFSKSAIVVKIQYLSIPTNQGVVVLEQMEKQIETQINGKPWDKAEALQKNTKERKKLKDQAIKQMPNVKEKAMWKIVEPKVSGSKSGYNLELVAQWRGPGSNPTGYDLKKLCQVNSAYKQPTSSTPNRRNLRKSNSSCKGCAGDAGSAVKKQAKIAQVKCGSVSKQILQQSKPVK